MRWSRLLGSFGFVILVVSTAHAQSPRISGYITDAASSEALQFVNVALLRDGTLARGAVTDRDGRYILADLEPGSYVLRASFIGYQPHLDTLELRTNEGRNENIALQPQAASLAEVIVESERTTGGARITAGRQGVRPADIELVPAPDVSGDLANYLTVQPGIVTTGDRGGQLYVRGGEPSQNLVLLDGMVLYQPFHMLGFYSAFPSDILSGADVYAGGYGARFGERISSVIDVQTRDGNKNRWEGAVAVSPFVATARFEGPVVPGRVSVIGSLRHSTIEEGAAPILGDELPFRFADAFMKVHAEISQRSRLSLRALKTYDRGTLESQGLDSNRIRWVNHALGMRYVLLPKILPVSAEIRMAYSRLDTDQGLHDDPIRSSSIENLQLALDATFVGERTDAEAGLLIRAISTDPVLGGLFQNTEAESAAFDQVALYIEPEFTIGSGLRLRTGARLVFYNLRFEPVVEPRMRIIWDRGRHQISGAAGVYHQEIVGLTDQRDAASVFTVWTNIPARDARQPGILAGNVPRAVHAILGYQTSPTDWLELSVEGFHKWLDNLFIAEWTSYPRLTTRLQPAEGRSFGLDLRAEIRRAPFYAFVSYGLSSTEYTAKQASLELWYGEETLTFRPPHDRRHQLNLLLGTELYGVDFSARWAFGSGLPYSRPIGFDGFVLVDHVVGPESPRSRRVIYEGPFNAILPTYHRLDVSAGRTFSFGGLDATVQASVINVYDRRNIFYVDLFTLDRADQLPFVPSLGLEISVD